LSSQWPRGCVPAPRRERNGNCASIARALRETRGNRTAAARLLGIGRRTLYAKIENLLDKKYEEADGFRSRPLNFFIGLRGVFGGN